MSHSLHIIKVGGSLLNFELLPGRLEQLLDDSDQDCQLIVVGGGVTADVVRHWDTLHHVGEEPCHWLALRAMQFNAHLLQSIFPNAILVDSPLQLQFGKVHLLDPIAWLVKEEKQGITIDHVWELTSDSVAAHIATQCEAAKLTLCKSTLPDYDCGLSCLAGLGIVDEKFPEVAANLPQIELVNLRAENQPAIQLKN